MNPTIVMLFALEFVSVMLAVILATAWDSFDRPRHALTWCGAFVVAAANWAAYIVFIGARPDDLWLGFAVNLLSMATWAVMLIGFRQRAGERTAPRPAIVVTGTSLAAHALATLSGHSGLVNAIPLLFCAAMQGMAAGTMIVHGGRMQAERAVITMLLAFALLEVVAAGIALSQGASEQADARAMFQVLLTLTMPSAFAGTGLFVVFLLAADLADRMGKLAASDPLTGILNRRGFEEAAHRAIANARRQRRPLTVVVADLDRFKSINDRFGHAVGDRVLCRFADHVAGSIRSGDLVGRIGGEEFAIVLVDADPEAAVEVVDRIRSDFAELEIATRAGTVQVTASFGVFGGIGADDTLEAMLARADDALYQAKVAGRDRVTLATAAPRPGETPSAASPMPASVGALSGTAAR